MTRLISRAALVLACAALAPVAAHAQATSPAAAQPAGAHPNFSGTWELNTTKSSAGMGAVPPKGTMTITQSGDSFARTLSMGDVSNTMRYTGAAMRTDTIAGPGGQPLPITSSMRWDGAALVVDAKASMMGTDIPIVSRYTLSPDGKQLMVDQTITTPMGEQTTHMVFDKKA